MKLHLFITLTICLLTAGCNSVYVKPNTVDPTQTIYADRGGYSMKRSMKQRLEKRGYNVVVGKIKLSRQYDDDGTDVEIESNTIPNGVHYAFKVRERRERFSPIWCVFNGFWFWNFNVSIADQKTGEELMTWRGRGCVNSSLRLLDDILDEVEIKK